MILTLCTPVQPLSAVMGACMGYVKVQIFVPVISDGKELIAVHALIYLGVYMEAAMVKVWLVTVMTHWHGRVACVTFPSVTIVSMANALLRVSASAMQDGQDQTVISVCH